MSDGGGNIPELPVLSFKAPSFHAVHESQVMQMSKKYFNQCLLSVSKHSNELRLVRCRDLNFSKRLYTNTDV